MNTKKCTKCGRPLESYKVGNRTLYTEYSGGLCLACYEEKFNQTNEQEKHFLPDLIKSINI